MNRKNTKFIKVKELTRKEILKKINLIQVFLDALGRTKNTLISPNCFLYTNFFQKAEISQILTRIHAYREERVWDLNLVIRKKV
jgi:hypothetical protein